MGAPMSEDDFNRRLHAAEQALAEIRVRYAEMEALVESTAKRVDDVKRDTEQIVELIKGATVVGRMARWVAALVGGYLAGKGLKWW